MGVSRGRALCTLSALEFLPSPNELTTLSQAYDEAVLFQAQFKGGRDRVAGSRGAQNSTDTDEGIGWPGAWMQDPFGSAFHI
eukprot:1145617-Pelagomonas_calceolata.AAC.8